MPPRKKTGVQNVDIGGAYKLEKENSQATSEAADHVGDQEEDVDAELEALAQEEDVDAELQALAQAENDIPEGTATDPLENGESNAAAEDEGASSDNQEETNPQEKPAEPYSNVQAMNTAEAKQPEDDSIQNYMDVDAELLPLVEEMEDDCDTVSGDAGASPIANNPQVEQSYDSASGGSSEKDAATEFQDGAEDMNVSSTKQVPDAKENAGDTGTASSPSAVSPSAVVPSQPGSHNNPVNTVADAVSKTTCGTAVPVSSTPADQVFKKEGAEASKPVFKTKKRQLAPVAQKPSIPTPPGPASATAPADAKPATGSRAGAMLKAVSSAANKAAGKFKGTAPSSGPTKATRKAAEGGSACKPAAIPGTAGKPASAGNKHVATAVKPSPVTAAAPSKTPSKGAVQKADVASNGENTKAADGKPKGKGKVDGSQAAKAPKAPRSKNAFMFFSADKRAAVKGDTPGMSMGDVSKILGEMWRGLSDADKKPYEDMAAADKERLDKVKADMPPKPKPTKPAKADKPDKVPRAKTAYVLFCDGNREDIKAANPGTPKGDINKLLAAAWKECSPEDKAKLQEQSDVAKKELQASAALQTRTSVKSKKQGKTAKLAVVEEDVGEEEEQEAVDEEASAGDTSADTAEAASEVVTGEDSVAASPGVGDEGAAGPAAAALADDDSDDEADREHADWYANPAEMIISHTYHNKYMVKRKGLDFTEYGLVDARAAKRQRLNTDSNDPKVAVSLQMVEEYDSFCKDFRKAVHENQHQGNLDLDNIGQGSPLEMCYYLGKLQEENYLLSKPPKRKGEVDVMIKVPMLGVSMVVQRLVNAERTLRLQAEALAAEKTEEAERLKGELTVLQMMATAAQGKATGMEE